MALIPNVDILPFKNVDESLGGDRNQNFSALYGILFHICNEAYVKTKHLTVYHYDTIS